MNKSIIIAAAFGLALMTGCGPATNQSPPLAGARMGGAFSLINQDGKAVTDRDFAAQYRLIYFGYSFCPDVCPVDVQRLMQGFARPRWNRTTHPPPRGHWPAR